MSKIYLVGCSKKKKPIESLAKDLYDSVLFRLICKELQYKHWYILSAKHGLLDPYTKIKPYDFTLSQLSIPDRISWSWDVFNGILEFYSGEEIVILAGKMYREFLLPIFDEFEMPYSIPMYGLGIGQQQSIIKNGGLFIYENPTNSKGVIV